MKSVSWIAVALAMVIATACKQPAPRTCNDNFAGGTAPVITSESLAKNTTMLCYEEFAVTYSGVSRTPLWSAEQLTRQQVRGAKELKRKNNFHAEEKLPASERSELSDYARSGYDRGHMTPSGDMSTENAQYESFSLANIIPQDPKNNQRLWAAVEEATRKLAEKEGTLYIVTGPLFEGGALQRINGRVLVPTSVFKAIYDPRTNQAGAYLAANAPDLEYSTVSIAELENRARINLFPALPPEVKASKMALPQVTLNGSGNRKKPAQVK